MNKTQPPKWENKKKQKKKTATQSSHQHTHTQERAGDFNSSCAFGGSQNT